MGIKKKNSLGLLKAEKDTSVVVAMSGGDDSSLVTGAGRRQLQRSPECMREG